MVSIFFSNINSKNDAKLSKVHKRKLIQKLKLGRVDVHDLSSLLGQFISHLLELEERVTKGLVYASKNNKIFKGINIKDFY